MDGTIHHQASRSANRLKAEAGPADDAQGLIEFACECTKPDCERSVRVPLYVYRRILEGSNQSLVKNGHHASPRYRTIIATGLMSIEERV
jgi:hypothetical protein